MRVGPAEQTRHEGQGKSADYAARDVWEDGDWGGCVESRPEIKESNSGQPLEETVNDRNHHSVPEPQHLHLQSYHLQSQYPPGEQREAHHCQRGGGVTEKLY